MARKSCSICLSPITNEEAPVLTMGAYGTPKLLCDECAAEIENMTRGTDYDSIVASMDEISHRMSESNVDDRVTMTAVTEMLVDSAKRAQAIREGTYDFSLDELEEEDYEIPEDMKETEEDRLLDEKERESNQRLDKFMNWVWLGVLIGVVGFLVWWLFF
nr:hypothetical protein [Clostridia bacterium]